MIGIDRDELPWVRALIALLRHPDPTVGELACHALRYLADSAAKHASGDAAALEPPA